VADFASEDVVVTTPEHVAFRLETAGLGSRFLAQLLDCLVLIGVLVALGLASLASGGVSGNGPLAAVAFAVLAVLAICLYWTLQEALWSGQTLGKRALHLRVVDASGGPITTGQALIRNLLRLVDFLPAYYAIGMVAVFATARNQRLGDLAAGTVVVRERGSVRLAALSAAPEPAKAGGAAPPPAEPRRLEPDLRRFVIAYAQRRAGLPLQRRAQLAGQVEPALRAVLPDTVSSAGPLAALDRLADEALSL
jgi:uncharacterized RDD family membrane protein YckC